MEEPKESGTGGDYSKGGWKKWILIYVVAAIVIYGAVYYFYTSKSDDSLYNSDNTSDTLY